MNGGENNITVLTRDDTRYPYRLAECDDAPDRLYMTGDINLNATHVVGIVGTRHATAYGTKFTASLVAELAKTVDDLLVISGFALGIDAAAHRGAFDSSVMTAGVLAHGLDHIYPAVHTSMARDMVRSHKGALVTEYELNAPMHKSNFLARNRLIAGMSDCVVVVESACRGGALSTARMARVYNRDVFAVPGRVTDECSAGCNDLIANRGAHMLTSAADLCDIMGWKERRTRRKEPESPTLPLLDLTDEEVMITDAVRRLSSASAPALARETGLPMGRLMAMLMALEIRGVITSNSVGEFELCKL